MIRFLSKSTASFLSLRRTFALNFNSLSLSVRPRAQIEIFKNVIFKELVAKKRKRVGAAWEGSESKSGNFVGKWPEGKWVCLWILVRIELPLVCFPRDHSAKNAQKCLEMLIKRVQRGNGQRTRAEILRNVAGKVNECACEFWWESNYPLYAFRATTVLKMHKNA